MIGFYVAGHLTSFTKGQSRLQLDTQPATVGDALEDLWKLYPGLRDNVVTEQGKVRPHVIVFIGSDDIRNLAGLETPAINVDEISILPAVSGG
jgi:molybdopterin converting factor small subunit